MKTLKLKTKVICLLLFTFLLSACVDGITTTPSPSALQEAELTTTPFPTLAMESETPPPTQSIPPTPTNLPPNTFSLEVQPWPISGTLNVELNSDLRFETRIQDLPPGSYLVVLDSNDQAVKFASMSTDVEGVLLRLGRNDPLPDRFFQSEGDFLLAEKSNPWNIYNLSNQTASQIGPLCEYTSSEVSPDGRWIYAACIQLERDEQGNEIQVFETIALKDGKGFRYGFPIPRSEYFPVIRWFDKNRLFVSVKRSESERANCAMSFEDQWAYCPPIIPASNNISYAVTDLGEYVAFTNLDVSPKTAKLIPSDCLVPGNDCSGVIDLGSVEGFFTTSPNFEVVGWITGIGPQEETRVGIYNTTTWESNQIVELDGNYTIETWCPDSSCIILYHEETFDRYRLDLDGTLTPLPYEKVIGSFVIP